MSTRIRRVSCFSLRQVIAIALMSVMISLLAPPSSAAVLLQTTERSVRAAGSQLGSWLASAVEGLGSQLIAAAIVPGEECGPSHLFPKKNAYRRLQRSS